MPRRTPQEPPKLTLIPLPENENALDSFGEEPDRWTDSPAAGDTPLDAPGFDSWTEERLHVSAPGVRRDRHLPLDEADDASGLPLRGSWAARSVDDAGVVPAAPPSWPPQTGDRPGWLPPASKWAAGAIAALVLIAGASYFAISGMRERVNRSAEAAASEVARVLPSPATPDAPATAIPDEAPAAAPSMAAPSIDAPPTAAPSTPAPPAPAAREASPPRAATPPRVETPAPRPSPPERTPSAATRPRVNARANAASAPTNPPATPRRAAPPPAAQARPSAAAPARPPAASPAAPSVVPQAPPSAPSSADATRTAPATGPAPAAASSGAVSPPATSASAARPSSPAEVAPSARTAPDVRTAPPATTSSGTTPAATTSPPPPTSSAPASAAAAPPSAASRAATPPAAGSAAAGRASAPAAATPPGAAPAVPDAVSARALDESAVRSALERYRTAYSTLDAAGARGVWPSVDVRALTRAFDQMESQAIRFDSCDIAVSGIRANASCSGEASYVPKVGNRNMRTTSRHWNFELRRTGDRWIISEVQTR